MEKTRALLKPGGIGLLHTIGKEQDAPGDAWTMRYIFPGAYLPILDQVIRAMGEKRLVPIDVENLRLHYAATLDEWARRFESNAPKIEEMFDRKTRAHVALLPERQRCCFPLGRRKALPDTLYERTE